MALEWWGAELNFYISENIKENMTAGSKARDDISYILNKEGLTPIPINFVFDICFFFSYHKYLPFFLIFRSLYSTIPLCILQYQIPLQTYHFKALFFTEKTPEQLDNAHQKCNNKLAEQTVNFMEKGLTKLCRCCTI